MQKTNSLSFEVVLPHTCLLGEGPVWNSKRKTIIWLDILNGIIHEFSPSTNQHHTIEVKDMVGAVAVCTDGNYIAGLKSGLALVNRETGQVKLLHHPEAHLPGNRFNDGKCDPAGRFWIGTMALTEAPNAGNLYMLEKDLLPAKKMDMISVSNGLAWSGDHQTFYYIDSPTLEVAAYDYDVNTGEISNKRVVIRISREEGFPDGMTIDTEGMLWIGHWDGWQVARWNPTTGEKLLSIKLPAARITSCTFGGDNLQDLYVTSAKVGLTEEQLAEQPLAGSLFVIRNCGYQGVEAVEFNVKTVENIKV